MLTGTEAPSPTAHLETGFSVFSQTFNALPVPDDRIEFYL